MGLSRWLFGGDAISRLDAMRLIVASEPHMEPPVLRVPADLEKLSRVERNK